MRDKCPLCQRYDCEDWEGHAEALRLDADTWPGDEEHEDEG